MMDDLDVKLVLQPHFLTTADFPYNSIQDHSWRNNFKQIVGEIKPLVTDGLTYTNTHPVTSRSPVLPPCRVCGAKASGFHYGVNTCEACKGFFRRSLSRQEPYQCASSGSCEIKKGRRTSCAYCRQKRCIEVGMSKTAIKTGRYTHQLRSRNILEVKMLEQNRLNESYLPQNIDMTDLATQPTNTGNGSEASSLKTEQLSGDLEMEELVTVLVNAHNKNKQELVGYWDDSLMLKRQQLCYERFQRKQEAQSRISSSTGETTQKNNSSNNNNNNLSNQSTDCLTSPIWCWPSQFSRVSSPSPAVDEPSGLPTRTQEPSWVTGDLQEAQSETERIIADVARYMEEGVMCLVNYAKMIPGFTKLSTQEQASLLKVSCFDVWFVEHYRCINVEMRVFAGGISYHADEIAPIWGEDFVSLLHNLARIAQKLQFTQVDVALLLAMIITYPDRAEVSNRELLEEIHARLVECFRYVLLKNFPKLEARFSKVIDFLVRLRELSDGFGNAAKNLPQENQPAALNPLLKAYFAINN